MEFLRVDQGAIHVPEHRPRCAHVLTYFFSDLRIRVFFQMSGIAVEFADALRQLHGRHCVLIVHPAEHLFV